MTSIKRMNRAWMRPGAVSALLLAMLCGTAPALSQAPGPGTLRRGPDGRLQMAPAPAPQRAADEILLPEPLAVELPAGTTTIAPDHPSLRALLSAATAGPLALTHDLKRPLGVGPYRVTWHAWDGAPEAGTPRHSKAATLFVLPHGLTPVGVTGSDHAIAGNTSDKIVRDAADRLHTVWLDAGRAGRPGAVMYRRARSDGAGGVAWETPPTRLNDGRSEASNAFVGLAASAGAVHVVWQANGSIRYRRLRAAAEGWDPIRDTGVRSEGHDVGPSVAAASDDEIHAIGPQGAYGVSKDGGARWLRGAIPLQPGTTSKAAAVALDRHGSAHIAYTGIVRGPHHPSEARASDGYWELRYLRRTPEGAWTDAQNVLAGHASWAPAADGADVLADWIKVAIDGAGTLHLAWHGTANTRIYGNDEPFYARRETAATGTPSDWSAPLQIYKTDRTRGERFAYAPSLAFADDAVIAVTFYEVLDSGRTAGFDSLARIIRRGALQGPPIPLTGAVQAAVAAGRPAQVLSTWFPSAAPRIHRDAAGRAWLDVLHAFEVDSGSGASHLVAYQRVDVTDALGRR